jgi:hypothetical protein
VVEWQGAWRMLASVLAISDMSQLFNGTRPDTRAGSIFKNGRQKCATQFDSCALNHACMVMQSCKHHSS